jgi:hypothetical protein
MRTMKKGIRYAADARRATLLLLGMLLLRALVPAGFMLAPVDGSLAFVLCEPGVLAGGHTHAAHDHAAHHHGAHADSTCPFALSAGPAPLPTLPVVAGGGVSNPVVSPTALTQTFPHCGPPRQESCRGPPRLA